MNKSKFLRKSLALLLSVLMVVAMIPVGASAADTTTPIQDIRVGDNLVHVSNKTFAAEVNTTSVALKVEGLQSGETVKLYKADDSSVDMAVESGTTTATCTLTLGTDWTSNGNVYTIPMKLKKGTASASYTIQLTKVAQSNTVEISKVAGTITDSSSNEYAMLSTSLKGNTINVEVPYGYTGTEGKLTIETKDKAVVTSAYTGTVATVSANAKYTVSSVTDKQTILVTSQDGARKTTYTVSLTKVNPLTSMTIGGVSATIDNQNDKGSTYSGSNQGKISVKLTADQLAKDKVTGKAPGEEFAVSFTNRADTTVTSNTTGSSVKWTNGKKVNFVDTTSTYAWLTGKTVTVTCKGIAQTYDLELTNVKSSATAIAEATVDGETATVSGAVISANLQQNASSVDVALVAPAGATIVALAADASGNDVNITTTDLYADENGNKTFTNGSTELDVEKLKAGVVLKVTAEDGTMARYQLKVTTTGTIDDAVLKTFALRIGSETYTGSISGKTVTVTVPYMTTNTQLAGAEIIATTNNYATVSAAKTSVSPLALTGATVNTSGKSGTYSKEFYVVSKKNPASVNATYELVVKLETAQSGMKLSSLVATSATKYNALTSGNTWSASIQESTTTPNTATVTVHPTYSDATASTAKNMYLKSFGTVNSGVAYIKPASGALVKLSDAVLDSTYQYTTPTQALVNSCADSTSAATIVVTTEVEARKYDVDSTHAYVFDSENTWTYTVVTEKQAAKTAAVLNSVTFGENVIGSTLAGNVAYGVTAKDTSDTSSYVFADFSVSEGASLIVTYSDTTEKTITLIANGDADQDGDFTNDAPSATNFAFMLVRDTAKKTVTPYVTNGTNVYEVKKLTVQSEAGSGYTKDYTFNTISYAAANTEAKITAFSVAGVAGSIKAEGDTDWTVTVNAPLGTDITSLVPTFSVSAGATVSYGSSAVKSGVTALDFTSEVVLKVTSEDGGKNSTYTVKVSVSNSFSDVNTTDWFYDNVMAAYNAGLCSGYPNGTFAPKAEITRRDVAIMIYKMMGSPAVTSTASFVDVSATDYAATAIAYLKEADIVSGYEDGTFAPAKKITRQEVASMLAKAKGLSGTSDNLFNDDAKIAGWAKSAVYACRNAGIFNGDNNGNFNAQNNIIRAEVATAVLQASGK